MRFLALLYGALLLCLFAPAAALAFETDSFPTPAGELKITFIGHGALMLDCGGTIVHVDPWTRLADYADLPRADLILISHHHRDHLDPAAIKAVLKPETVIVAPAKAAALLDRDLVRRVEVFDETSVSEIKGLTLAALPAYNLVHKRDNGQPFHPKGEGLGYIVGFGGKRIYIAGDTENIPEMAGLKDVNIAFLPMNLPYTMTPEMVAQAALSFRPALLYPYHYGQTDASRLVDLLKDEQGIEVRIRPMR